MGLILIIFLVVILVGGLPRWNYSRNWGYKPTNIIGAMLIILLILVFMGYVPR